MPEITNNTRETLNFVTGVKDGEVQTDAVKAGETKNIAVDPENPEVKAREFVGAITVGGTHRRKATAPKAE